jgi:hypothetical protein
MGSVIVTFALDDAKDFRGKGVERRGTAMTPQQIQDTKLKAWYADRDNNGDGVVQVTELPTRFQKAGARLDQDGDSNLSFAEINAMPDMLKKVIVK